MYQLLVQHLKLIDLLSEIGKRHTLFCTKRSPPGGLKDTCQIWVAVSENSRRGEESTENIIIMAMTSVRASSKKIHPRLKTLRALKKNGSCLRRPF